jgi:pimeloyl-ACP methyl ester carboxylesterase
VTAGGLRYDRYGAHREWMMRIGPEAPAILFVPPLLEEMNRTRAFMAAVMRGLSEAGYGSILPDLPGTGESERALSQIDWTAWRQAVSELAPFVVATVAIRGGCLLDDAGALPSWRLAPVDGASLVRDLERSGMVSGGGSAGYDPSPALVDALRAASPAAQASSRVVRLASDRGEADLKVDGPPLWRRSEPQTSSQLASLISGDIIAWVRQCAAS